MSEVKKPIELIIRKTEWSDDQGLETEWDIYDPKCNYMCVGTPDITDIPMIEKSAYEKAIEALKDSVAMIGVATILLEFHGKPSKELKNCVTNLTNAEARVEKILKELGYE